MSKLLKRLFKKTNIKRNTKLNSPVSVEEIELII